MNKELLRRWSSAKVQNTVLQCEISRLVYCVESSLSPLESYLKPKLIDPKYYKQWKGVARNRYLGWFLADKSGFPKRIRSQGWIHFREKGKTPWFVILLHTKPNFMCQNISQVISIVLGICDFVSSKSYGTTAFPLIWLAIRHFHFPLFNFLNGRPNPMWHVNNASPILQINGQI